MNTTKEDIAKQLDGMEYQTDISPKIIEYAKAAGLVIVYGYSDDLMELEGAIHDEGSCYEGEEFLIDAEGLLPDYEDISDDEVSTKKYHKRKPKCKTLEAVWCAEGEPAWTYKTKIPHATFNIKEDGEVQCRGIVFDIKDLTR